MSVLFFVCFCFLIIWGPRPPYQFDTYKSWRLSSKVSYVKVPLCSHEWPSKKPQDTRLKWASLVGDTLYISHIIVGKIKCYTYNFTMTGKLKLMPGLSWTLSYVPFTFTKFNLYLSAIISCNWEYNSFFLSSMSPSKESSNLRVVLGIPNMKVTM